jgi:acyl-CoA hydrolase
MANKENKAVLKIDDNEYLVEDMTNEQKTLYNHLADITRKIETMSFNLEQLQFGKGAFVNALKESLSKEKEEK